MTTQRIALLDVLRGIAILGTLGTNVWVFMHPGGLLGLISDPESYGLIGGAWFFLTNGKSLAMLTILFGVGVEIQRRSAARRGARWPGRYLWRATLLLLDGVLHYVLVTEVDVLMAYAMTSMVVAYVVTTGERATRWWLGVAVALHLAFVTVATLVLMSSAPGDGQGPPPVYLHGSYLDQIQYRLELWPVLRFETMFLPPFATVLFMTGVLLYRAGAFGANTALRRRLAWWGLGLGLPLNALTSAVGGGALAFADRYVTPPLVALGFLGLFARVFRRADGWLATRFALIGRMSLTCYMLQNAVAMAICFGWGLGLAGVTTHRPLWTFGLWLVISAIMMTFSWWWLSRFRQGPVEAVWRWAVELGAGRVDSRSVAT